MALGYSAGPNILACIHKWKTSSWLDGNMTQEEGTYDTVLLTLKVGVGSNKGKNE